MRTMEMARIGRSVLILGLVAWAGSRLLHVRLGSGHLNGEVTVGTLATLAFLLVSRSTYRAWLTTARRNGSFVRDVLVVGTNAEARRAGQPLRRPHRARLPGGRRARRPRRGHRQRARQPLVRRAQRRRPRSSPPGRPPASSWPSAPSTPTPSPTWCARSTTPAPTCTSRRACAASTIAGCGPCPSPTSPSSTSSRGPCPTASSSSSGASTWSPPAWRSSWPRRSCS